MVRRSGARCRISTLMADTPIISITTIMVQLAQDRVDCRRWASEQTSYDPTAPNGRPLTGENQNDYLRAEAACLEGRGYTVR